MYKIYELYNLFSDHAYCTMYSVQCTLYNVHTRRLWTYRDQQLLYNIQCTVYIVHCTHTLFVDVWRSIAIATVYSTVYNVQCTMYSVQCTVYTVQCTHTLCVDVQSSIAIVQCTMYSVHHCTLYVIHLVDCCMQEMELCYANLHIYKYIVIYDMSAL